MDAFKASKCIVCDWRGFQWIKTQLEGLACVRDNNGCFYAKENNIVAIRYDTYKYGVAH